MNINTNPSKPSEDSCPELKDVEQVPQEEPENPDDPIKNRFDDDEKVEPTTPKAECPAWPPKDCELAKGEKVRGPRKLEVKCTNIFFFS